MPVKVHHNPQLLQAIIRDPENIESRLVYADWLEEQSDPQSQLIRTQCEIATGDPRDTRMIDLDYQERTLMMKHRSAWTKAARGFASKLDFRLGLVGWAGVTAANFLEQGESLYSVAPIMELRITHPQKVIESFCQCETLAKVHTLNIRDGGLGLARLRTLLASPHLRQLKGVDLGYNGLKASSMQLMVEHAGVWPQLRELKLECCGITLETLRALLDSGWMNDLRKLSLGNNDLDDECLELLAESKCLANTQSLDIEFSRRITPRGLEALWSSKHLNQVQHLSLRNCEFSATTMETMRKCRWPLTSLDLSGNVLSGAEKNIGQSPAVQGLTELNLAGCNLADAGFAELLKAANWQSLRSLDLSTNPSIGSATVDRLGQWPGCEQLTTLILTACHPGEEGLKSIGRNDRFRNLHELRVCDNTDKGVEAIIDAEHLDCLTLIEVGAKSGKRERMSESTRKRLVKRFGSKACRYTYWFS